MDRMVRTRRTILMSCRATTRMHPTMNMLPCHETDLTSLNTVRALQVNMELDHHLRIALLQVLGAT